MLKAFADHGEVGAELTADGGDCERVCAEFRKAGVDLDALAAKLQEEGVASFAASWNESLGVIACRRAMWPIPPAIPHAETGWKFPFGTRSRACGCTIAD